MPYIYSNNYYQSVYSGDIFIATKILLHIASSHIYLCGYRHQYIQLLLSSIMVRGIFVVTDTNIFTSSYRRQWREMEEGFEKLVRLTKLLSTIKKKIDTCVINNFNNCFSLKRSCLVLLRRCMKYLVLVVESHHGPVFDLLTWLFQHRF